ncbi:hypothetical protein E4K66_01210 [Bradyrhizobium frederickii]|uniref:Uncharacterized protein n=1 Tax=Bradyrhizobium frederickii TaxID=2560054 RepID=A0A4Y9LL04_9BRAD|nr:hypothetical protein [Bradyrhizobium frederickii]TFV42643.1 hypothetical protein E4K66_01210 [Bradyrhizobium frederickii]
MDEGPDTYRILRLRAEILELGSAIRQLQRAGLDDATAQLLIGRKRAELERLVKTNAAGRGLSTETGELN